MRIVPRSFYLQDTLAVAHALPGRYLVREAQGGAARLVGRIVETEAYRQDDPASHSFPGPTARNRTMFLEGGLAYVYFIYGRYDCLNVVTEGEGYGGAVLIRALEPLEGLEIMWGNRFPGLPFDPSAVRRLCSGPGKLARAFGITVARDDGKDLQHSDLTIREDEPFSEPEIVSDTRIGIRRGREKRWRFLLGGSGFVSRPPADPP